MKYKLLENNIKSKNSFLCLGLDTDINKIPKHFLSYDDPVFYFNKAMVDRLHQKVVAVKIKATTITIHLGCYCKNPGC